MLPIASATLSVARSVTFLLLFLPLLAAAQPSGGLVGSVVGSGGEPIVGANVSIEGTAWGAATDEHGRFAIAYLRAGNYWVRVSAVGFEPERHPVRILAGELTRLDVRLALGTTMPEVVVVGQVEHLQVIPGSASVLSPRALEASRPFTPNEALRKLPGVHVRDEEGFGLRPNIGIRGLSPLRSAKVTLLEDGILLAYAPYGDNAAYFQPPIDRYKRVEVLKGAGQIMFGPQTIGGVVNFITPPPPVARSGFVSVAAGSRDYFGATVRLGGHRMMVNYTRKQGAGARENIGLNLNDVSFKAVRVLGNNQALTLRAHWLTENSTVTYSGLTEAEFRNFGPRYNPFHNDRFYTVRYATSATHYLQMRGRSSLTTNLYFSYFDRDWWRQSSTTTDTQGGAAGVAFRDARLAGMRVDPDGLNSVHGWLREYWHWGVEPRLKVSYGALGLAGELHAGVRAHFEIQDREHLIGTSPTARTGTAVEDNLRKTQAYSAFLLNRLYFGEWAVTSGIRYQHLHSARTNRLPGGAFGSAELGKWIPGLGVTWNPAPTLTVFAGVHRGFAPPRTEDVIDMVGTATEVDAEESTNWELGARIQPRTGSWLQATLFRNDFKRLTSGAISQGAWPLAQGEALFQGVELSGHYGFDNGLYFDLAYTWLPVAEQTTAFRRPHIVGGAIIPGSTPGNRQPYAPEHMLTAAVGYAARGFDAVLEAVHVAEQFADFANTVTPTPDGQRGLIEGHTIWNATVNYYVRPVGMTVFVRIKNLTDKTYITDRTRGIEVGSPRLVHVGVRYAF